MSRVLSHLSLLLLVSCGGKVASDWDGRGDIGEPTGEGRGADAIPNGATGPGEAAPPAPRGDAPPNVNPTPPPDTPRVDPPCSPGEACADRCGTDDCVTGFALGPFHTCAAADDGSLRCWGANESGQVGLGFTTDKEPNARSVALVEDVSLAALGQSHTCVVHHDRTVSCWGGNEVGQLGRGSISDEELLAAPVAGIAEVAQLVSGLEHTCARRYDGSVSCWGSNDNAQLGRGYLSDAEPVAAPLAGLDAVHIAAGRFHTCAIEASGAVNCWGHSITGTHRDLVPTRVGQIDRPLHVGAGFMQTCAALESGRVECWSESGLTEVTELVEAVEVTWGHFQGCARDTSGIVRCWGQNAFGELGIGYQTPENQSPTEVSLPDAAARVQTTNSHSCALLDEGSLWCWGPNFNGENGDGTFEPRPYPVRVRW